MAISKKADIELNTQKMNSAGSEVARNGYSDKASSSNTKLRTTAASYLGVKSTSHSFSSFKHVQNGIPAARLRDLESQGLTRDDIQMVIPARTLERRIAEGTMLKLDEADGIARLLRVVAMARQVFANDALADEWLRTENAALDGNVPMQMARTDLGGREVEAALGRIEHGVFG